MKKLFIILLLILACNMVSSLSCDTLFSSDGESCVEECDYSKREYDVNSRCTTCTNYWNPTDASCTNACSQGEITDTKNNLCYRKKIQCTRIVSSDGKNCVDSCIADAKETGVAQENGAYKQCATCLQYYVPATQSNPSQCLSVCPSDYITYETGHSCLLKLTDCKNYISANQKNCIDSCDTANKQYNEITTVNGLTYNQCNVCTQYYIVNSDSDNKCQSSCMQQVVEEKPKMSMLSKEQSLEQVVEKPNVSEPPKDQSTKYVVDEESKICYFSKEKCPKNVSANGTACVTKCNSQLKEVSVTQDGYKQCTVCNYFFTPPSGIVESTCTDSCAQDKIQDDTNQVCLSASTECKDYVSSNGKKCSKTCDESKNEYPKQFTGYQKCVACTDYFTSNEDVSKRTCKGTCDSGYLKVSPTSRCIPKDNGCGDKYLISSDGTICDNQCNYPDIQKGKTCVTEDFCTGESNIIDETKSNIICFTLSNDYSCALKSSDSKRCVKTCLSIKQAEPEQGKDTCQACVSSQKFYLSVHDGVKTGGCKANVSADDQKTLLDQLLDSTPQTTKEVESIKQSISEFTEILASTITASSNNLKIVDFIENYAVDLLKKIQNGSAFSGIKNSPQTVGSSTGVKTVFQAVKSGKKFKKSLNIKSMMSDSPSDMTEDNSEGGSAGYEGIVSSIIKKNPGCKSENCQDYPAVKVKGIASLGGLRRILVDQTFSADFPLTQASQNYVCLTYNLQTNEVLSNAAAKVSSDGTTATCELSSTGSTSLYLDTTCQYLDHSKCSSDDGLSTGGIVGIIIGSVAFAGIVGGGCFFFYKHMLKRKLSLSKYQSPKGTESV